AAPPGPWMYTGALENSGRLIETISQSRPLLGNPTDVLQIVRDPFILAEMLREHGHGYAEVRLHHDPPPVDGSWLIKPWRSAGGRAIRVWDGGAVPASAHFFQRRLTGLSLSAAYLSTSRETILIGCTRQRIGGHDPSRAMEPPAPFAYCGSIGPMGCDTPAARQSDETARRLATQLGLRGLWGVDFIDTADGPVPVEVNPRYTASMEVLEHALGLPLIDWHCRACVGDSAGDCAREAAAAIRESNERHQRGSQRRIVAKTILYASRPVTGRQLAHLPVALPSPNRAPVEPGTWFADLPAFDILVEKCQPLCTVLAAGSTWRECLRNLSDGVGSIRDATG
ncbi:MAG: ATP-grasp domain-containing protein, partial [Planctomycetes bacterium]|nr:ATP-grasp domain-containing protein [Planctomycetota bacterium]